MYGAIIVHPSIFDKGLFSGTNRLPNAISNSNATNNTTLETKSSTKKAGGGIQEQEIGSFDMSKFIANKPDLILTNGMAYKYIPFIGTQTKMILNEDAEAAHEMVYS